MEHNKNYDLWNTEKKLFNSIHHKFELYVHEREIWWTSVGINIGTEIDGKNAKFERPVLILRKLGKEQFIGIPLTSRSKSGVFYHSISYGKSTGTVCISQIRVFSVNRFLRKIGKVRQSDFELLNQKFSKLFLTGKI